MRLVRYSRDREVVYVQLRRISACMLSVETAVGVFSWREINVSRCKCLISRHATCLLSQDKSLSNLVKLFASARYLERTKRSNGYTISSVFVYDVTTF